MTVYIDVHTHHVKSDNPFSVLNLTLETTGAFFASDNKQFCSLGIHPWDVHLLDSSCINLIEKYAADKRLVAIGECGLDKNSKATIKEQNYFFERQIMLSKEIEKPLIIHCVACFNELIQLKKKHTPKQAWIIHGFRGKPQLAKQLIDHGFVLSFGANYNPKSVELTPKDRLCIETDESDKDIAEIYKEIASIKSCGVEELNAACHLLNLYVC